jgi:CRP-like cAMP-binding protein
VEGDDPTAREASRLGLMNENIWFLKRCDLFERLMPAEARRLESRAVCRTFKRREIIYFPAEPGQTVLVVLSGRVKIKAVTPDGKETIFSFFEAGELFGELALVGSGPRDEYAEAVEDSRIAAIPREDVLWLMEQRPDVALRVTKLVGLRRRRIENRLRNILFRSNRERIVSLLLELLEQYGQARGPFWEIRLRLSHQDLANLIGATRETVTVTLGQLQRDRLVRVDRKLITVLDRARLAAEDGQGINGTGDPTRPGARPRVQF